jgi:hypothetical protein
VSQATLAIYKTSTRRDHSNPTHLLWSTSICASLSIKLKTSKLGHASIHISHYVEKHKYTCTSNLESQRHHIKIIQAYIYPTMSEDISILARQNMSSIYHENRWHPKLGHTCIPLCWRIRVYKYIQIWHCFKSYAMYSIEIYICSFPLGHICILIRLAQILENISESHVVQCSHNRWLTLDHISIILED